jgi:four helix bundle protein
MARYNHLNIFQKSYDLLERMYREVHNFPREYKYTLGAKIQDVCIDLLDNIITANSERNKVPHLKRANQHLDRLRIYVRLCRSLNIISSKKYETISRYINEIGKMLGGWLKSSCTRPES